MIIIHFGNLNRYSDFPEKSCNGDKNSKNSTNAGNPVTHSVGGVGVVMGHEFQLLACVDQVQLGKESVNL